MPSFKSLLVASTDHSRQDVSTEVMLQLENAPIFDGLQSSLLLEIARKASIRQFKKNELIIKQGQANDQFFVIISGVLTKYFSNFEAAPIAYLGPGDCFGEISFVTNGKTVANVVASEECKVACFHKTDVWDLINRSHKVAHNMLKILGNRIREDDQKLFKSIEHKDGYRGISIIDELTGLHNRSWMDDKLNRILARSKMEPLDGYLLLLEIDRFDSYKNDFGELGGDQAIRSVAYNILACIRPDDHASHHEGPQFCIYLAHSSKLEDACSAIDRLRAKVSQTIVLLPTGNQLPDITGSIGATPVLPDDALHNLYERANKALAIAKELGGNCFKVTPD